MFFSVGKNINLKTYSGTRIFKFKTLKLCFSKSKYCKFLFLKLFLKVGDKIFNKIESGAEMGTTQSLMTRTGSSNAKKGPKRDYNKDFDILETKGHILAAWMEFAGMDTIEGKFSMYCFLKVLNNLHALPLFIFTLNQTRVFHAYTMFQKRLPDCFIRNN